MVLIKGEEATIARAFGSCDYNKVIELRKVQLNSDPTDIMALWQTAYCYEQLGENESAKKYYSETLAADSTNFGAVQGLARIYAREKNYDIAYRYVVQGLRRSC